MNIQEIKERLDNCIDLYTSIFCAKHEVFADGWIGDIKGGLNCFSDAFISFEDIRLDLEKDVPKGVIFEWYWENKYLEGKVINFNSYLMGLRVKDLK
jgi:hypothetical protein